MNIHLIPREVRDVDTVLAFIMMAAVAIAACAVIYLLGRHLHHKHKAPNNASHNAHGHKNGHPHAHDRPHDHTNVDEG